MRRWCSAWLVKSKIGVANPKSDNCKRAARAVATVADATFWNEERGLYADDLAHENWSEHAQCLVILSGFVPAEQIECFQNGLLYRFRIAVSYATEQRTGAGATGSAEALSNFN